MVAEGDGNKVDFPSPVLVDPRGFLDLQAPVSRDGGGEYRAG
jgi:hypothetical protein